MVQIREYRRSNGPARYPRRAFSAWPGIDVARCRRGALPKRCALEADEVSRAVAAVRANSLRVGGIASPVFKSPFDKRAEPADAVMADYSVADAVTVEEQLVLLERACRLAKLFDMRLVRVFTCLRVAWTEDVVRRILRAVEVAARHQVTPAASRPALLADVKSALSIAIKSILTAVNLPAF